ncbi:NAD(P)/FAD-dependent oxidoreductase [Nioella nitratireducens]|uniref:NAD(P)/FAD-dependent oxidoreductase n=1 Tax=Nioella nitratireducens TaxID=1287720 RepID=UPI0008FD8ED2|nr:FAD-dependent oxidoreductase [Nioella nitratireducens]
MKTIVIGAGILGAAIANRLAGAGAEVQVVEAAAGPASAATGCSFGWINASFYHDADHFRLRAEGIAAWHRLGALDGLSWPGSVTWEAQGDALARQEADLVGLGYRLTRLTRDQIRACLPHVACTATEALAFPAEGAADAARVAAALLSRAQDLGARVSYGVRAEAITTRADRVTGLRTQWGDIPADHIIVAAANRSPDLVAPFGAPLPMLRRPGALMVSQPVAPVLDRIVVTPERELRQDGQGRILAPTSVSHQSDSSEVLAKAPEALAEEALASARALLPGVDLRWQQVLVANRPVPGDGLPVIGAAGPEGLTLAVMHSGVTLAAVTGEAVADDVMGGDRFAGLLAPYRQGRFRGA